MLQQSYRYSLILSVIGMVLLPVLSMAQQATQPLFAITLNEAEDSVASALIADGVADTLKADIISTRQPLLYQYKQPLDIQVKTLKHNEAEHSWSANLLFAYEGNIISAMPVSGRYEATQRVPVLTQRLSHGETIGAQHITMKEFPASKVRQDVVLEEDLMIGKTPRRTISVSRPIRSDELQEPDMVKKGSMLKMTYQTPYMEISATGQALENGANGQTIRVQNTDSHGTVYGVVVSADEVQVTRPSRSVQATAQR
ncbi:MAG: flagellar basal body P-ring formation chaperone FlgA [Rickettsiales bacterium]|nr:flagellar basal body P-ring formation chaperone FlgA [Rickettsiales bacterium]